MTHAERPHFWMEEGQVAVAEALRKAGFRSTLLEAIRIASAVEDVDLENFDQLEPIQKRRFLQVLRLDGGSRQSLAMKFWRAEKVAAEFKEARRVINEIYDHRHVWEAAQQFDKDPEERAYDFDLEMERDRANYLLKLFGFTGNTEFLTQAISILDAIAERENVTTSVSSLARFEGAMANHQGNRSRDTFANLQRSYKIAHRVAREEKNWNRVTTLSSRYAIESARSLRPVQFVRGALNTFRVALSRPFELLTPIKEFGKSIFGGLKRLSWRRTRPEGSNYAEELRLAPRVDQEHTVNA